MTDDNRRPIYSQLGEKSLYRVTLEAELTRLRAVEKAARRLIGLYQTFDDCTYELGTAAMDTVNDLRAALGD